MHLYPKHKNHSTTKPGLSFAEKMAGAEFGRFWVHPSQRDFVDHPPRHRRGVSFHSEAR